MDIIVRVRLESAVERAIRIEPGDVVARLSDERREAAACENLAVRLHRDGKDISVRVRVESAVERAIRIEPSDVEARHSQNADEAAANENLAVWLNGGGVNKAVDVRIESIERGLPAHRRHHSQKR